MSVPTDPSDRPPPSHVRCPRCGGVSRPHKRRGAWANPFLPKAKSEITCDDCGLDFDPAAAPPSTPPDAPRSSGQGPWGKA